MVKPTFHTLQPEKRDRILLSAARLFARHGFAKTDVAQIATEAGVAKGSIYNYFESKDDIYVEVCRDGLERSRKAVYGGLDPAWDVYRQIDHIFHSGAPFALEHPEYILLYLNVSSAGMERFAEELSREVEKYTAGHLKRLIRQGIEEGIVRGGLDVNMAAFSINGLYILFLLSLVSRHFRIRMMEYLELEGDVEERSLEEIIEKIIGVINAMLKPG